MLGVQFQSVRWKNFLSTVDEWIEIDFAKSKTTLVIGKNGTGKSQMLDALFFSLFDTTFRKLPGKTLLINTMTNKKCVVEVLFKKGDSQFMVRRGMKPTAFEVWENGVQWDADADRKDTQAKLEKTLGQNRKSFRQIVVLGTADYTPFMRLDAADRRKVVEDLLDLVVFSDMNALLAGRVKVHGVELSAAVNARRLAEERWKMHEKHAEELRQNNAQFAEDLEDKAAHAEVEALDHRGEAAAYKKAAGDQPDVGKIQATIDNLRRYKDAIESRLYDAERIAKKYDKDVCPECEQPIDPDMRLKKVEEFKTLKTELEDGLAKLAIEDKKAKDQRAELMTMADEYASMMKMARSAEDVASTKQRHAEQLKQEAKKYRAKMSQPSASGDGLKDELETAELLESDLVAEGATYEAAAKLLKDNGIKSRVITRYIPLINQLINKYLAAIEFVCHFEVNSEFKETIKSRYRETFVYESFSEGQKRRIDLAFLFTWRELARIRNSSATDLIIFDEILDSSLDQDGIDELMKILNALTIGEHVMIMSHRGDQLADKFTDIIKFEMAQHISIMHRGN